MTHAACKQRYKRDSQWARRNADAKQKETDAADRRYPYQSTRNPRKTTKRYNAICATHATDRTRCMERNARTIRKTSWAPPVRTLRTRTKTSTTGLAGIASIWTRPSARTHPKHAWKQTYRRANCNGRQSAEKEEPPKAVRMANRPTPPPPQKPRRDAPEFNPNQNEQPPKQERQGAQEKQPTGSYTSPR